MGPGTSSKRALCCADAGHVRYAVPAAGISVAAPGRLHLHEKSPEAGQAIQRRVRQSVRVPAIQQSGRLRSELGGRQPFDLVRPRLESSHRQAGGAHAFSKQQVFPVEQILDCRSQVDISIRYNDFRAAGGSCVARWAEEECVCVPLLDHWYHRGKGWWPGKFCLRRLPHCGLIPCC